jgi:benzoylsuccinyl-CoA thiolase BbsA subunit
MEPVLTGRLCKTCGRVFFPKKRVCTNCLEIDNMVPKELSRVGKLISYTINYVGTPGFKTPYAFGYIELPEDIWIYSTLVTEEPSKELRIGMDVELVSVETQTDDFGRERFKWEFKPLA